MILRWVREGLYPRESAVSRDDTKYVWGERNREREEPGFPKLASGKVMGWSLCFWRHYLAAV